MTQPEPHRSLWTDRSFWGLTVTQFLGAFNDNLYKQLLLLLFVAVPVVAPAGQGEPVTADRQAWALFCFSLPFILFSGYAGFLSDKYSKSRVIVLCKAAEVAIMVLGVGVFVWLGAAGMVPLVFGLLCLGIGLMGSHSAFFGPSKYGSLPELLPERHLPAANGVILMTTFIAIILGSALAGVLKKHFDDQLWLPGLVCVAIAGIGTGSACLIRRLPASSPNLAFDQSMLGIPRDIAQLLRADRFLRNALIASTVFWLTAALVQPGVNALGDRQLALDPFQTSLMVTVISLGIALGSVLAGLLSRGQGAVIVQRVGAWGMVSTLVLLCLPGGTHRHFLGYHGSLITLTILGGFTGMFAVPLQVFLQSRPPSGLKGRMIATQNLLNWVGIFVSTGIYAAASWLFAQCGWPPNAMFGVCTILMLPVALAYRPVPAEDLATSESSD